MGMAAILFNGMKPFEQIVNILSTEGPMWNVVKIVQVVSEKKMFKDFIILHIYIALWLVHINHKILTVAKQFYIFIICC